MSFQNLLPCLRLCIFCIGLAACAGQLRSVPATTSEEHPVQEISPEDLRAPLGRITLGKNFRRD